MKSREGFRKIEVGKISGVDRGSQRNRNYFGVRVSGTPRVLRPTFTRTWRMFT